MIKFQQSQALTSHFESFWSIVPSDGLVNHVHGKFVFFKNFDCQILLLFFTFVKVGFYWPICVVNALKARK